MKRSAFRLTLAAALICCLLGALFMTGCGKDAEPSAGTGGPGTADTVIDSTSALLPDGTGIRQEHIVLAGFGMGTDTSQSVSAKFGAPESTDTKEYSAETVVTDKYSFGVFEFDGPTEGPQVLTYVGINGELSGPCMVVPGDDLYLTADAIYTDSSKKIRENRETENTIYLYGDENSETNGQFMLLESEFVTSDMPEESCLSYTVPFSNGGRVRYVIYFDSADKATRYDIFYEKAQ